MLKGRPKRAAQFAPLLVECCFVVKSCNYSKLFGHLPIFLFTFEQRQVGNEARVVVNTGLSVLHGLSKSLMEGKGVVVSLRNP